MKLEQLLESAQQMQSEMARLQSECEQKTVEATAGGGMIAVKVTGAGLLTEVTIDPSVVNPAEVTMLQDLVLAAVNEGLRKSKDLVKSEVKKLTGGLPLNGFLG